MGKEKPRNKFFTQFAKFNARNFEMRNFTGTSKVIYLVLRSGVLSSSQQGNERVLFNLQPQICWEDEVAFVMTGSGSQI
jgi:hypothetical protein